MNRIEVNVQTGERKVIDLTPEEEADALKRTAAEIAKPKPTSVGMVIVNQILADSKALAAFKAAIQ